MHFQGEMVNFFPLKTRRWEAKVSKFWKVYATVVLNQTAWSITQRFEDNNLGCLGTHQT